MSLKTVIVEIEEGAEHALTDIGTVLKSFVLSETLKLVAELKATPLGTMAMNFVSALTSHTGTGEEKMAILVAAIAAALEKLKAAGGLTGLLGSIADFAKEFAQSVYNDFAAAAVKALTPA